jgi:uncharacterized protein (TIGR03437 family)
MRRPGLTVIACLLIDHLVLTSGLRAQIAPVITPGGVVNGIDYSAAIAPGMVLAVFGSNLAANEVAASDVPLPNNLDGTTVEVNGQAVPLFFVSGGQVNAQLPFGLSGAVQVRVRNASGVSAAATVTVLPTAPRFFTKTADGQGEPIVLHSADFALVTPARPGVAGEFLTLYLSGLGAVTPAVVAGQPGGDGGKLGPVNRVADGVVSLSVNGKAVPVLFAGLAPGFVGLYQVNFQVPADIGAAGVTAVVTTKEGASTDAVPLAAPTVLSVGNTGTQTVGGKVISSSGKLSAQWTAPGYTVDHYVVTATEGVQNTQVSVNSSETQVVLTGLKAGTEYQVRVTACGNAACLRSGTTSAVAGTTGNEYWQLQGTGNSLAGLSRIVSDGNAKISATRFGPEAGPVTANRLQLYYGPSGQTRQTLTTAITSTATTSTVMSSYLSFVSSRGTTGLITPSPAATRVSQMNTGQGVPLSAAMGGKVRLFFEAQGTDQKTRIFSIDSVDGYTGQDFNSGPPTTCSTAADYSAGGGCTLSVAVGVEGDSVAGNTRIPNARQQKVGYPTLADWRWNGAAGTFMVFTTDTLAGCTTSNRNHGYAVWDENVWTVQYDSKGCPKLFTSAQAAFPMHSGGVKYRLYYGDPSVQTGKLSGNLPFLGPKKMIYGDGTLFGQTDRVDFEDWENQGKARDIVFLWPNGDTLDDTAEGYIDDYHFLAPTGSLDLQVMYLAITNGVEAPIGAGAVLLNP